jgi:hypothetical protein
MRGFAVGDHRARSHRQLRRQNATHRRFFASIKYSASIYSWSRIKLWVNGAQTEIANLEAKAAALKAAL